MGYQVPAGISNKHIHLSRKDMDVLFGEGSELTKKGDLKQPGQFAAEEQVVIEGPKGSAKLRVLGPFRKETQVELAMTDARTLGIKAPVRESGHLEGTPGCKLIGPCGEVELDHGVMVAQRHVHLNPEQAIEAGVKDKDIVCLKIDGERGLIFDNVVVRTGQVSVLPFSAKYIREWGGGYEMKKKHHDHLMKLKEEAEQSQPESDAAMM